MENKLTYIKKKWFILIGIILLFAVTNPTKSDFTDYLRGIGLHQECTEMGGRTSYYLIFSIYAIRGKCEGVYHDGIFIGIFKNFFEIGSQ
jgi:hypothetical protein